MSDYKAMSLRESAAFDHQNNLKNKLTGWGIISKRNAGPDSKTQKRKKNRK